MLEPYTNRLIVIREMLDSPLEREVDEAYELLLQLRLEYQDNSDFIWELEQIAKRHPELFEELEIRLQPEETAPKKKQLSTDSENITPPFYTQNGKRDSKFQKTEFRFRIIVLIIAFNFFGVFVIMLVWGLDLSLLIIISILVVLILLNYFVWKNWLKRRSLMLEGEKNQGREKETPPEDFNKRPLGASNVSEKPLIVQFDSEKPFHIRLVPEEPLEKSAEEMAKIASEEDDKKDAEEKALKNKKVFSTFRIAATIVLLIFIATTSGLYINYFVFRDPARTQEILPDVSLICVPPKYLVEGDQNTVDITISNLQLDQSFSGSVTLVISNKDIPVASAFDQNLSVTIAKLRPGDRATEQVELTLPARSSLDNIDYHFHVFDMNGNPYITSEGEPVKFVEDKFRVFFIPHLTTIVTYFISGGVISTIISWWDQIKKFFVVE